MSNVCYVQHLLLGGFVMSKVCNVQRLCLVFVLCRFDILTVGLSRVCFVQGLFVKDCLMFYLLHCLLKVHMMGMNSRCASHTCSTGRHCSGHSTLATLATLLNIENGIRISLNDLSVDFTNIYTNLHKHTTHKNLNKHYKN